MGYRDYYKGPFRDYHRDPFPHSLLSNIGAILLQGLGAHYTIIRIRSPPNSIGNY